MSANIITAAERAARKTAPQGKVVGYLYKKNPDGTRCKTCRPVPVYAKPANELVKTPTTQH